MSIKSFGLDTYTYDLCHTSFMLYYYYAVENNVILARRHRKICNASETHTRPHAQVSVRDTSVRTINNRINGGAWIIIIIIILSSRAMTDKRRLASRRQLDGIETIALSTRTWPTTIAYTDGRPKTCSDIPAKRYIIYAVFIYIIYMRND